MYIEAHVLGEVSFDDFESISYALGVQEQRKEFLKGEVERRKASGEGYIDTLEYFLEEIESREAERISAIGKINDSLKRKGLSMAIETKNFDKEISAKDGKFDSPGAQKLNLTSDQLF